MRLAAMLWLLMSLLGVALSACSGNGPEVHVRTQLDELSLQEV